MLPFLAFLGHNAVYLLAGFLCFCWLKHEEDAEEPTTVQKHSRAGNHQGKDNRILFPSPEARGEHGSCAVSRAAVRPAEVLREGSGIKGEGTAGDGVTIRTYIKDAGNLPETSWA